MKGLWRNKKNNGIYTVINEDVLNCTNDRDGQEMVLYMFSKWLYVRSKEEFLMKFERLV